MASGSIVKHFDVIKDISSGEIACFVDTLNKFDVPEKEHNELMAIIASLRPDIVEVEDM